VLYQAPPKYAAAAADAVMLCQAPPNPAAAAAVLCWAPPNAAAAAPCKANAAAAAVRPHLVLSCMW
jgi:hypothetical protein